MTHAYLAAHRRAIYYSERRAQHNQVIAPEPVNFCAVHDDGAPDAPPSLTRRQLAIVTVLWLAAMAGTSWLAGWI